MDPSSPNSLPEQVSDSGSLAGEGRLIGGLALLAIDGVVIVGEIPFPVAGHVALVAGALGSLVSAFRNP